jgi:hypothetical protein
MVHGKRPRFTYNTKGEAETKAEQLRIERENDGNAIVTPIYEITTSELETWLRQIDVSATTQHNYRTALGVLFSFALRRGYVLKNPAAITERAKVKAEKPAILTVAEARALIDNAELPPLSTYAFGSGFLRACRSPGCLKGSRRPGLLLLTPAKFPTRLRDRG